MQTTQNTLTVPVSAKALCTMMQDMNLKSSTIVIPRKDDDIRHDDTNTNKVDVDSRPTTTSTSSTDENDHQVYRFKLDSNIQDLVTAFAKVHQYDTRKDYKEAWKEWSETNADVITREDARLVALGYTGDVLDKMYKAGRYYFRTKKVETNKKAKKRRQYISMDNATLTAMDEHIAANCNHDHYTPASGYSDFVEKNQTLLLGEIQRLMQEHNNSLNAKDITLKVKKTYKNRYYLYSRQQND